MCRTLLARQDVRNCAWVGCFHSHFGSTKTRILPPLFVCFLDMTSPVCEIGELSKHQSPGGALLAMMHRRSSAQSAIEESAAAKVEPADVSTKEGGKDGGGAGGGGKSAQAKRKSKQNSILHDRKPSKKSGDGAKQTKGMKSKSNEAKKKMDDIETKEKEAPKKNTADDETQVDNETKEMDVNEEPASPQPSTTAASAKSPKNNQASVSSPKRRLHEKTPSDPKVASPKPKASPKRAASPK